MSPFRFTCFLFLLFCTTAFAQRGVRTDILLNEGWRTAANDTDRHAYDRFETAGFRDAAWKKVSLPHNWDQYEGYRRLKHGNRHGYAWYRKTFSVQNEGPGRRYFLWFEGVGSYATVWLNGRQVGAHKGGRTSFTLDITDGVCFDRPNLLAVRADHPAMISDLPWVCGGCSDDRGFSEGSQPMGIHRPVHLVVTGTLRVEPFGVHVWNDVLTGEKTAALHLETELKNYGSQPQMVTVVSRLLDARGHQLTQTAHAASIDAGADTTLRLQDISVANAHLWSPGDPYLYTLVTEVREAGRLVDQTAIPYGIRWISWPVADNRPTGSQFFVNGRPVFINGTAGYEHLMGRSHAFTPEQVKASVMQVRAAGFNAFRDAHQPHNLLFQAYWDKMGILWWPQFSAHDWYDTPEFRANFKSLLTEWVKERRNSPSNILWGLQNESKLPEAFARECTELIRRLDPTASSQRKVTTCNGGTGTDWDVPQNWTGTYGGDPLTYAADIRRQLLIGEYGAWRSLGLHTEGNFKQNGPLSEDRMTQLMETKVRLAESVRDQCCGQFHWLMNSHENPGRIQGGEGVRELDRIGPVNYKGLFTPWGEPTDAYFMFRANYAPKDQEPMVYIVSHTWPYRWNGPGLKDSIIVYSNCDEVELFNDKGNTSLGVRTRQGTGTHFQWDGVPVRYNMLYAVGRVGGKVVAEDSIFQSNLPAPGTGSAAKIHADKLTRPAAGYHYLYRVNCGGPDLVDGRGNTWMADRKQTDKKTWGSRSWTNDFVNMTDFFASQRTLNEGEDLFRSFRYGMDKLQYNFPLPNGNYLVELYFTEPWYGPNVCRDCSGWRLFNVALNGRVVEKKLDIWAQASYNKPLKKTYPVRVTDGQLTVSFPDVAAGEAVISAIAIASTTTLRPAPGSPMLIRHFSGKARQWSARSWLTPGDHPYADQDISFSRLPPELYGAEWIQTGSAARSDTGLAQFQLRDRADVYIGIDSTAASRPAWMKGYTDLRKRLETSGPDNRVYHLFSKRYNAGETVSLGPGIPDAAMYTVFVLPVTDMEPAYDLKPTTRYEAEGARLGAGAVISDSLYLEKKFVSLGSGASVEWRISVGAADTYALRVRYINRTGHAIPVNIRLMAADGTVMKDENALLPLTTEKWATFDSSTGYNVNAGNYLVVITSGEALKWGVDYLEVQ